MPWLVVAPGDEAGGRGWGAGARRTSWRTKFNLFLELEGWVMVGGILKLDLKFWRGFCDVYFFVICSDVNGCMTRAWNSTENDVYF